jgi:PAB1-binding protein PBP1
LQQGHKVRCTLRTGIVYTAILSAVNDADLSVCLKLARQIEPPLVAAESSSNGSTANGTTPGLPAPKASLVVAARDVIEIYAENVSLDAATVSSTSTSASRPTSPNANTNASAKHSIMAALNDDTFRTDTDISGTGTSREQRELLRWGAGDSSSGGGLEDGGLEGPSSSGRGGKGGAWDQFAVNEKLFGTSTDYREEIYTTRLDKSGADYKAREARAAKLAEEIQSVCSVHAKSVGLCSLFLSSGRRYQLACGRRAWWTQRNC